HYGAPWAAGALAQELAGLPPRGVPATGAEIADYVIAHYEDMLALYGVESGLRQARKHLGWYLGRHSAADVQLRSRIMTAREPAEVIASLRLAFIESAGMEAAA